MIRNRQPSESIVIYKLVCNGVIGYVGQTNRPAYRLREHIYDATRGVCTSVRERWIAACIRSGQPIELIVIQEATAIYADKVEAAWAYRLRAQGHKLTNDFARFPESARPHRSITRQSALAFQPSLFEKAA